MPESRIWSGGKMDDRARGPRWRKNKLRIVDLFCGCGGLSLGFSLAGFEIVCAFEKWDPALKTYQKNFSHPVEKFDLINKKEAIKKISNLFPDIIIGGPPCQDFSHAGKRTEGSRADLTVAFAEIVESIRPSLFLMENVDRAKASKSFAIAREIFKKSGYGLTEMVLDASLCGVPQKRKRFFCVGKMDESDGFLSSYIQKHLSKTPLTIAEYMGHELEVKYYYRHPRNYNRRAVFSINEPSPTIRGVNRPIPSGYPGHPNDPIPTHGLRPLTTMERARIQTFPKNFQWVGSKTDIEQMIGNAVPVQMARLVAISMDKYLRITQKGEAGALLSLPGRNVEVSRTIG